jgi:hypothetical protein
MEPSGMIGEMTSIRPYPIIKSTAPESNKADMNISVRSCREISNASFLVDDTPPISKGSADHPEATKPYRPWFTTGLTTE